MSQLDARIKQYEKTHENKVSHEDFLIVRIDGHKFSNFTKKFHKPYDHILSDCMVKTTCDLVKRFGAVTGYTQSDEITLVFPPVFKDINGVITNNQIFAGRTQKIASLIASFTSIRFNHRLSEASKAYDGVDLNYSTLLDNKIGTAYFDARIFGVPSDVEAFNVILWRYRDAIKNSKSMFAQAYCSHKSLLKKTGKEQVAFCLETTGRDWNDVDNSFRYGVFIKKEKYMKPVDDEYENVTGGVVERSRVISFAKGDFCFSDKNVELVVGKYM